jgi:cytochrome o ubiquinol oxidase subunit III
MSTKTLVAAHGELGHGGHGHEHHESHSVFGFWLYLMTDCFLFASLFVTFAVLGHQFAGGPTAKDLFDIPGVAMETALLLLSSITYGFAMISAYQRQNGAVLKWLAVTFLLGVGFLVLEMQEFAHLIHEGAGPQRSAFFSAFFALVGTHGLHVTIGLIWMAVLMVQVIKKPNLTQREITRLTCLSLFWHFLDIVWICVFTFVYLASVI